jgi:phosphate transport system substrate-binding protein
LTAGFFVHTTAYGQSRVKIDGSSTVFPITEAVAEDFQNAERGATRVTVGISGTGGGFKKFCRGETDVQDASRPITDSEMEACRTAGVKYLELPIAYDAMVVAVNLANPLKEIKTSELKKIWEPSADKTITKWNQVNPKWPNEEMKLYGAGTDSGTFDYFTEAIVGKSKSSRADYTASEDDNTLVTGIGNDKWSLGYIPLAYFEENQDKLKALAIINDAKKTKAVMPSKTTVENGTYVPLSRPIFIYVSEASLKKPAVKKFVEFYLDQAPKLVAEVKYVPLPSKVYTMAKENLKKNKLGSMFAGAGHDAKLEQVMKKAGKM